MTSVDGRARTEPDGAGPDGPSTTVRATPASADPDDPAEPTGSDTGTVRRSRPPRPDGGEPTLRTPVDGVLPAGPVRRPVPPTFPSPGQPPPGVARRDGRHARPDIRGEQLHTPPTGYRPRHAAPDAETEQFAVVTTESSPAAPTDRAPDAVTDSAPLAAVATSTSVADGATSGGTPQAGSAASVALPQTPGPPGLQAVPDLSPDDPSDRVRVVLAERRAPTRAVRTVAEIEAQTETGELLLGNLLRAQLTLAVRLGLVAVLLLGSLPVLFLVLPALGSVELFGLRVPWLLVGFVPYPFLVLLGWLYIRTAERNELDFADNVED